MTRGPLNRVIGTLGLLALVPTAVMSATGTLTAADTAVRAGVTLVLAILVRKVVAWYITSTATSFEKRIQAEAAAEAAAAQSAPAPPAQPVRRRRSDADDVADAGAPVG